MLFQAKFTIPKNTTEQDPKTQDLKIAHGIITEFKVRPRPGHAGLAHVVILYHEHQIVPSTQGMSLYGDSWPIDWGDYYECYQPPYVLKLKGWNDDDTFSHTFDIFVAILPRKAIVATSIVDALKNMWNMFFPKLVKVTEG